MAAGGDWEQARWELRQAQQMLEASAVDAAIAASRIAASVPLPAQLSRQASVASGGTALSSHLLAPASDEPFAAAAAAADGWAAQDPPLAGATSAWQQGAHPAPPASAGSAPGFDDGFAAGMATTLQGWQREAAVPPAAAVAPGDAAAPAYGWAGGVPPPQERPPADDAEVDDLMAMLGIA